MPPVTMRARVSAPLPGDIGTMYRTVFCGYGCASTAGTTSIEKINNVAWFRIISNLRHP